MWHDLGILYYQLKGRYKDLFQTEKILKIYQSNKLRVLLEKVSSDIRYYQSYKHATLYEYPIIDKTFVQEHFAALNRMQSSAQQIVGSHKSEILEIHQSLGTSGVPGTYLYSVREKMASLGNMLAKFAPVFFSRRKKIAVFHMSSTPYLPTRMATENINWLLLDLNEPFDILIEKLQQFDPEVLIGSAQTLCELARLQQKGEIYLRCKKLISTAEVLTPMAQSFIAYTFKQVVHQLYQCAEGNLGITCEYGTLHLNEDEFYIEKEWIDHNRQRFVPVITTLKRFLQPLIRYRMDDILVLKKLPCACGNPFLGVEKVIGRCEDVLYFKEVMFCGLKPIYADTLNQLFFTLRNMISQYQILQHTMHHVVVKILAENFLQAKTVLSQKLDELWKTQGIEPPLVEFDEMEPIVLNKMFKSSKRLGKSTVTILT